MSMEVVIGNSLKAVLFAHYKQCTLILNSSRAPFRFDTLNFDIPNFPTRKEHILWSTLVFELSMKGLVPHGTEVDSIRIQDNIISTTIRSSVNIKNEFSKAYIFEDDKLTVENEIEDHGEPTYRVLDWMNVRSGAVHELDIINTGGLFVNSVHFYKSERIDGNHNKKDLVAVSTLNQEQLSLFDYSDTIAKFKVENLMRENGIKGTKSGLDKHGKPKRYNIKVEPDYREVLEFKNITYKDSETVVFPRLTIKEIVEKYA